MKRYDADYPSGTWIGLGFRIQAQASFFGLGDGAGALLSCVVSADHPQKYMIVKFAWGNQPGYSTGLGISEETVIVLITSLYDPTTFFLTEPLGLDFQIDVGAVIRPMTGNLRTIANSMRRIGLKNVKVANLRFLAERIGWMVLARNLAMIDFGETNRPNLQVISIPAAGLGLGAGAWTSTPAAVQVLEYPA